MVEQSGTDLSTIDVSLDPGALVDEQAFLGQVVIDEFIAGQYGPQWHVTVKPLEYELKGKTGAFHNYAKISQVKKSTMGAMILAFSAVFGTKSPSGEAYKLGRGMFTGQVAWFVRRDLKFGFDKAKQQDIVAEGVLIPVKKASQDDLDRVQSGQVGTGGASKPAPHVGNWSSADAEAMLAIMAGKRQAEYQKAAVLAKGMSQDLKNAILSGAAERWLVQQGLASVASDGTLTPTG